MTRRPVARHLPLAMVALALAGIDACTSVPFLTNGTPVVTAATSTGITALPPGLTQLPNPVCPPPITRSATAVVPVTLVAKPVTAMLDPSNQVAYTYWTYALKDPTTGVVGPGTVPGPMVRVLQGDVVDLTLQNDLSSTITHSIDTHASHGPGGGAKVTQVAPGGSAEFQFLAENPGVYVYHCATALIPHHISSGMYGLMVVEPASGSASVWGPVNQEYYVMQGDMYIKGGRTPGLHDVDITKLRAETPDYYVFNGSVGSLSASRSLTANVGDTCRIFFGVGGPAKTSSFHVIGTIFDKVFPEGGSIADPNVQTTMVPAGGATIAQFHLDVPGNYSLVDHSLTRMEFGALGIISASGAANPAVFNPISIGTGQAPPGH